MPSLSELLTSVPDAPSLPPELASLPIHAIAGDSRRVEQGTLFIAVKGEKQDGADFIPQAVAAGAVAVLSDRPLKASVPVVHLSDVRRALAHIAANFYPAQPEKIVAVTGTDGKTSTADFYRQLCKLLGHRSVSIGTLGIIAGNGSVIAPATHTTPDAVFLHKMLAAIKEKGTDRVAIEASSHGLDQHRLDAVKLEAAAFTNIARDHLDYHHTVEEYFAAKSLLFSKLLPEGKTAVLNADDAKFVELSAICAKRKHRVISFGKAGKEFHVVSMQPLPHGQKVALELFGKSYSLEIPLVGAFQAMNILAALGLAVGVGEDLDKALAVIPQLKGVPGRLEQVATLKNGATVFIDYAHTPMALANILTTLRPHTQKRLHVLFGCGGDRDPGKRPEMGKIASDLADVVTVTDDNPRSENPALIRSAIMAASPRANEVADRGKAIYAALKQLQTGDILVLAGKGHEKVQIIGSEQLPFDDADVARSGVSEQGL